LAPAAKKTNDRCREAFAAKRAPTNNADNSMKPFPVEKLTGERFIFYAQILQTQQENCDIVRIDNYMEKFKQ
jgi:hypothetical protein